MQQATIAVTGAAGFIGSRLVARLVSLGHSVWAIDRLEHFFSRPEHWVKGPDGEPASVARQLMDRDAFLKVITSPSPSCPRFDAVFHMGACSRTTEFDVAFLQRVNVDYSKAVWNFCTQQQIPLFYASSAATYGGGELGYADDEELTDQLRPLNPYGESKRQFDIWALDEAKKSSHPLRWAGFKFFNVYGFGERHKGAQASVLLHGYDQILREKKIRLFRSHRPGIADGEQKRDFIWVEDVVDALLFAWDSGKITRGIYNLGSGQARSFLDLAQATFAALGMPPQIEFIDTPVEIRERYQYFTEARMDRLRQAGYDRPFTSLEAGAMQTVASLRKFS